MVWKKVLLDGEDVSEAIRTPEVSLLSSQVSAQPAVRRAMLSLQRKMGESGGVVLEGRDIGTVVFSPGRSEVLSGRDGHGEGQTPVS